MRRAAAVALLLIRQGRALDLVYASRALHADQEDLIQKAVGWALREAGKTDMPRLERYLRANGAAIPRTTLRYAIERFPPRQRHALLIGTRDQGPSTDRGRTRDKGRTRNQAAGAKDHHGR